MSEQLFGSGFQLNEHGARAMAQGGAFAARAGDPSTIFFNPAGVSWLRGTQILGGATLIRPRFKFRGPTEFNTNQESEMIDQFYYQPNFYMTHSWDEGVLKGLGVGIGLNSPYGFETKWDDNWIGKAITQETNLKTYFITPTVSYAFNDLVSVGVGVNYVRGSVTLRQSVTLFDPPMNLNLEGDGDGIGWNAGVLVKPIERISLGFSYRSSVKVDFAGTANFNASTESMRTLFPGGDVKTSVKLPATYFAGIAFQPIENFEVEFDYQGISWSSYDKLDIDFVNDVNTDPEKVIKQADVSSQKNYQDTYILRAGAEYNFPNIGLKARLGYLFDKNPVPDEHLEPFLPDANRNGFNIGLGYKILSNLSVDVSYLYLSFKQRTTDKTDIDTINDTGVAFNGTYNGNASLIGIDFLYNF